MSTPSQSLGNRPIKEGLADGTLPTKSIPIIRQRSRDNTREQLQSAILRVKDKGKKLTISAVASEAGVTPGLIHNTYPDVAEAIRAQVGKGVRQQRDDKISELSKSCELNKELRSELNAALKDIRRLASTNETLRLEVDKLRSVVSGKVVVLPIKDSGRD